MQHNTAHSDDAQILRSREAGRYALLFELCALGTENPRNKGGEATRVFGLKGLKVANGDKVIDPLVWSLDMAIHHRCRSGNTHLVRLVHNPHPVACRGLGGRYALANIVR